MVTRGSVEERIILRAEKKLYLDKMVNRDSTQHVREGCCVPSVDGMLSYPHARAHEPPIYMYICRCLFAQAAKYDKLGKKAMLELLKFGAHAVFGSGGAGGADRDAELYPDDVLGKIIDRTTDWTAEAGQFKSALAAISSSSTTTPAASGGGGAAAAAAAGDGGGGDGGGGGAGGLGSPHASAQHTAADFTAEQVPLDFRDLHAKSAGLVADSANPSRGALPQRCPAVCVFPEEVVVLRLQCDWCFR